MRDCFINASCNKWFLGENKCPATNSSSEGSNGTRILSVDTYKKKKKKLFRWVYSDTRVGLMACTLEDTKGVSGTLLRHFSCKGDAS